MSQSTKNKSAALVNLALGAIVALELAGMQALPRGDDAWRVAAVDGVTIEAAPTADATLFAQATIAAR